MRRTLLLFLLSFLFLQAITAQTTGDIAFVGFNADGDDDFAIVTFVDLTANTTIYFRDSEWNGTALGSDEGSLVWNSGTDVIAVGTVITFNNTSTAGATASVGTITNPDIALSSSAEGIFAYLGMSLDEPTVFLAAVGNADLGGAFGTLEGTGLTAGLTAILLPAGIDVADYIGPRTGLGVNGYLVALNTAANYVTQDGSGDQHNDGTAPDLPFDTTPFVISSVSLAMVSLDEAYTTVGEAAGTIEVAIQISGASGIGGSFRLSVVEGTATPGQDFTLADTEINLEGLIGTDTTYLLTIALTDDAAVENSEWLALRITDLTAVTAGSVEAQVIYIVDNDGEPLLPTETPIDLNFAASYQVNEGGSAEIVAHDPATQRLFVINSSDTELVILDFSDPRNIIALDTIDMTVYGSGITSVAVRDGLVAVAVVGVDFADGRVVFFDTNGAFIKLVTVGNQPDHIGFTPDGDYVLTANEGQPNSDYTIDPEGSVSIIDLRAGAATLTQLDVTTLDFNAFDSQLEELRAMGVRIFGPGASVSQDLEPEFIAISEDGSKAYVTIQEANAFAVVDLTGPSITDIWPLGYKDHLLPANALDASDRTDTILLANWPILGMYHPDGVAYFEANGQDYLITANEGDSRDYDAFAEEERIGGVVVYDVSDPTAPVFIDYVNSRTLGSDEGGDLGAEGLIYIHPDISPLDTRLIVVANEISATISVYTISGDTVVPVHEPSDAQPLVVYPNPTATDLVYFNRPVSVALYDLNGRLLKQQTDTPYLRVSDLPGGAYVLRTTEGEVKQLIISR